METIMLTGHFDSLLEFCEYTNDLVGDELVGYEGYVIRKVIHFQILPAQSGGIDALVLVEVQHTDTSHGHADEKPYHVQCFVRNHVAHEDRFQEKDVALSYARTMQGQWTNNTPDREMHQFTRIAVEERGKLIFETPEGLYDQGHPPESEGSR